jgi:hypothetical protein
VPEPALAKAGGAAARDWLAAREADLLPVGYFHLVFTLPAEIAPIAYQNKPVVYDLLFRTAAKTLLTIAPRACPVAVEYRSSLPRRRPGVRTGCTADPASYCRCACCPACSGGSF